MSALQKAKELIFFKENWTRFCFATDRYGNKCPALSGYAVKWDASGATVKCGVSDEDYYLLSKAAQEILENYGWKDRDVGGGFRYHYTPDWPQVVNDDLGHEYVLQMYDRAIQLEKEKDAK